jgi:hypothetical protein
MGDAYFGGVPMGADRNQHRTPQGHNSFAPRNSSELFAVPARNHSSAPATFTSALEDPANAASL